MEKVKCRGCGFLSVRENSTQELRGIPETLRETGEVLSSIDCRNCPYCFVGAFSLHKEAEAAPGRDETQRFLAVINKERLCHDYIRCREGFSPKEHREMFEKQILREEVERRMRGDREWQEARRNEDQRREDQREQATREWQRAEKWSDRKWQVVWLVIGAVLGALGTWVGKQFLENKPADTAPASQKTTAP
jgi:hypothetical protein